jgi:preprotein translocase subunit SecE
LAERRSPKPQVGGSIPSWPATKNGKKMMNNNVKTPSESLERFMWVLIVLVLGFSIAAYYYLSFVATPIRLAAWLVLVALAFGLAAYTQAGKSAYHFVQESVNELYKVVWPTRKETFQNTFLVLMIVFILAMVVWGIDTILLKLITVISH